MTTLIDGTNGINNVAPNTVAVGDLAFAIPFAGYYETVISGWAGGQNILVTHNLGVIPKLVAFEVVAKAAIYNLAIGETEEICAITNNTTSYNCEARKKTTTTVVAAVGAAGIAIFNATNIAAPATPAQVDLKIKVFG